MNINSTDKGDYIPFSSNEMKRSMTTEEVEYGRRGGRWETNKQRVVQTRTRRGLKRPRWWGNRRDREWIDWTQNSWKETGRVMFGRPSRVLVRRTRWQEMRHRLGWCAWQSPPAPRTTHSDRRGQKRDDALYGVLRNLDVDGLHIVDPHHEELRGKARHPRKDSTARSWFLCSSRCHRGQSSRHRGCARAPRACSNPSCSAVNILCSTT